MQARYDADIVRINKTEELSNIHSKVEGQGLPRTR
jgi:hypothetical protein